MPVVTLVELLLVILVACRLISQLLQVDVTPIVAVHVVVVDRRQSLVPP